MGGDRVLDCDNLKSFRGFFSLVMIRGKRRVFIGLFPYRYRAESMAGHLDWEGFYPEIQPWNGKAPDVAASEA
jgi:hypothetical protein